jgi:hypothetical protein
MLSSARRRLAVVLALVCCAVFTVVKFGPVIRAGTAPLAFAPSITATNDGNIFTDADGDARADPGDTVEYTVTINNIGTDPANNVVFQDTLDANMTLVGGSVVTSPIAAPDAFAATGNVRRSIPDGGTDLLANDINPLTGTNAGLSVVAETISSANCTGGCSNNVAITADGSFTYNPPPGFEGTDTFTYTATNGSLNATGTTTFTVSGMIWFVNASAGAGGDGRLTNPFNCLVGAGCFNGSANDPGDNIFLYSGAYTGGLTLKNNQRVIGQGASSSLSSITTLTPPAGSDAFPVTGGANPTITTVVAATNGITLGTGNVLRGFTVGNTTGAKISGNAFGTLTLGNDATPDVTLSGTGQALDLVTGAFATSGISSIESTNSPSTGITLDNSTGSISVTGTTAVTNAANIGVSISGGSGNLSFGAVTVNNRNSAGVFVNAGSRTISFGNVTIPNPNLSDTTAFGVDNTTGGSVNVSSLTINNNGGNGSCVALSGSNGSVSINGGTLSNATNAELSVSFGTGNVTSAAAISNASGRSVQVLNRTGGTVDVSGNISDTGNGILVQNNSVSGSPVITFSGATKTLNTGANTAVTLDNNDVATINFTNGGLDIDTTSGTGFTVINGAAGVNVSGAGNSINSGSMTALNVETAPLGMTFESIASTNAGTNGINLDATSGSFAVTGATTVSNAANAGIRINGGSGTVGFGTVTVDNRNSAGVNILGGNKTITMGSTTIPNPNTSGTSALAIDNMTAGSVTISSVTINNNAAASSAIALSNNDSTINIQGGSVSNAAGATVSVSSGAGNITYSGTIGNTAGRSVQVLNNDGGSITFNGAITDTGTGVFVDNNTSTAITFAGGLSLNTGTTTAFTATGGGTVNVCDEAPCNPAATGALVNTLTTTTATALNVVNTTIGANNLEFRSISSNGAASGVILNTTGSTGGLIVKGTGTAGSGGTIQTGATGISLTSTRNVSLTRMQLNGFSDFAIRGSSVVNFTLADTVINGVNGNDGAANEGSVRFTELTGSATVSGCNISGGFEDNFAVINTSGSLNRITFSGTTIGANSTTDGSDGILIEGQNAAVVNTTVQNGTFTSSRGDHFQINLTHTASTDLVFTGNNITNAHPAVVSGGGGVRLTGGSAGGNVSATYNISNNTMRDSNGTAIGVTKGAGTGTMSGTINNNQIGVVATLNSGSAAGSGISVISAEGGTSTVAITNNQVRQYGNFGIIVQAGGLPALGTGSVNATVTGNVVSNPGNLIFAKNGFQLNSGTNVGDVFQVCLGFGGAGALRNSLVGTGTDGGTDFRLRQRQTTTVRLPGYGGVNNDDAAVTTFAQTNNNIGAPTGSVTNTVPTGGGFIGGAACTTPPPAANPADETVAANIYGFDNKLEFLNSTYQLPLSVLGRSVEIEELQPDSAAKKENLTRGNDFLTRGKDFNTPGKDSKAQGEGSKASGKDFKAPGKDFKTRGEEFLSRYQENIALYQGNLSLFQPDLTEYQTDNALFQPYKPQLSSSDEQPPTSADLPWLSSSTTLLREFVGKLSNAISPTVYSQEVRAEWEGRADAKGGASPPREAPFSPMAGETITVSGSGSGFTLPAGSNLTIKFRATIVAQPPFFIQVSNQGSVAGSNFATVVTDDPSVAGPSQPTLTAIDHTTVAVVSNANPSVVGQNVTFTATLTGVPSRASDPPGTVLFKDNGVDIGVPVAVTTGGDSNNISTAQVSTTALTQGNHTITAEYSGGGVGVLSYNANAGTLTGDPQVVDPPPPPPTLGNYPATTVDLSDNITITPDAPPTGTTSVTATTTAGFIGPFEVNPATGVVRLTNAHPAKIPAGAYTVTVTAFGPGGTATRTIMLTVNNGTPCLATAGFASPAVPQLAMQAEPRAVAIADFNGDGNQDIAVANSGSSTVSIRLGNGSGGFTSPAPAEIAIGIEPYALATGDFNADGRADLAIADFSGLGSVAIRLGNGSGGFTSPAVPTFTVGLGPSSVAIGDFNGDGRQDFATANQSVDNVSIRLGDGSGGFTSPASPEISVGSIPVWVAIGDFNGDGNHDFAAANLGSANVSIRLGNGSGGFTSPVTPEVTVGTNPFSVAIGDFNGDGTQDFATANGGSANISIRIGNGSGGFTSPATPEVTVGTSPNSVAVADFNGDGRQDLATANAAINNVSIRLGNGAAGFTSAATPEVTVGAAPLAIAIGDFNGDGRQDFVTTNRSSNNVSVRLGDCTGPPNAPPTFTPAAAISVQQGAPAGPAFPVGTVADAESPAGTMTVIQIAGGTAAGITVSGIINNSGSVTGVVTASLAATSGTVRFQVTDGGGLTGIGDLQVNVSPANTPPTIVAVATTRNAGSPASNSTIANVTDAESGNGGVTVTVNGGATATVNGVTVSNIQNNGTGGITADVVAACGATNASFTLTATDGGSLTATDTLNVTVVVVPPTLSYNTPAAIVFGAGTTVGPATGPADNGSVASIAVQNTGSYTGTVSVHNTTGVVTFSNAAPVGSHTIVIRITDNCGTITDASFTLTVNKADTVTVITGDTPDPSIIGEAYAVTWTVTPVPPGAGTPSGNVTVVDGTGGTCTAAVAAGTCNVTSTSAGVKTLVATYSGDASFNGSTSAGVSHTVNLQITGTIRQYPAMTGLANVTVRLLQMPGATTLATTTTNASGQYTFAGVFAGNVAIVPDTTTPAPGRQYDPQSRSYNAIVNNITGADFTAYNSLGDVPRTLTLPTQYVVPGAAGTMPVILNSQDNEAQVSFTITYDINPFAQPPTFVCGTNAPGCTLVTDTSVLGRVGVTITPAGGAFSLADGVPEGQTPETTQTAGPKEIARMNFQTLANNQPSTPITFVTTPVNTVVRDAATNPLLTNFVSGLIVFAQGNEGDVSNRNAGNGSIDSTDVVQLRRFVTGLDTPVGTHNEFQRADTSPAATKGNGQIDATDVIQTRRYATGLDGPQAAGGPGAANPGPMPAEETAAAENSSREIKLGSSNAATNSRVTIPVEITGNGDEMATSFVVRYDHTKLGNPTVETANVPEGATLTTNTDEPGIVRILIDGTTPFARSKDANTILNIAFDVSTKAPTGDTTVELETVVISDAAANSLTTKTTNGRISIAGPNALGVEISGRVMTPTGQGLRNATVTLTDANGQSRTATTGTFGFYRFEATSGEEYVIAVFSRRYRFI